MGKNWHAVLPKTTPGARSTKWNPDNQLSEEGTELKAAMVMVVVASCAIGSWPLSPHSSGGLN